MLFQVLDKIFNLITPRLLFNNTSFYFLKPLLYSHHREETINRIKDLQGFIDKQKTDITEFDEALVKKLIEKITVFADHFTVEFKSGLTINI